MLSEPEAEPSIGLVEGWSPPVTAMGPDKFSQLTKDLSLAVEVRTLPTINGGVFGSHVVSGR